MLRNFKLLKLGKSLMKWFKNNLIAKITINFVKSFFHVQSYPTYKLSDFADFKSSIVTSLLSWKMKSTFFQHSYQQLKSDKQWTWIVIEDDCLRNCARLHFDGFFSVKLHSNKTLISSTMKLINHRRAVSIVCKRFDKFAKHF